MASGNNQSGVVSTPLSTPLTVQVRTSTGVAVVGTSVTFSVATGGGSVSPAGETLPPPVATLKVTEVPTTATPVDVRTCTVNGVLSGVLTTPL